MILHVIFFLLTDSSELSHTLVGRVTFQQLWKRQESLPWAVVYLLLLFKDQCV